MSNFKVIPMRNFANEPSPTDKLILIQDGATTPEDLQDISSALSGARKSVLLVSDLTATLTLTDEIVLVDDSAPEEPDTVTITLPSAEDAQGKVYTIKKIGGDEDVEIEGDDSETIDGATTFTLALQYDTVTLVSNGTEWFITSTYSAPIPEE